MADYALEIDGWIFKPIPEVWLEDRDAIDHDPDAPPNAVRLYATSAAVSDSGRALRLRYLDPLGDSVLTLESSS